MARRQIATLYVEKDKGILYATDLDLPLTVSFPRDVIDNLEVVDKSKLDQIFSDFITKNKLKPMHVFIILNNSVTIEKELKEVPPSLQGVETEKFLDLVPFHQILSKTYNFSSKTIIATANRDLVGNIVSAFHENLFSVTGVIPQSILEELFFPEKKDFDQKIVLKKIENLKRYFFPLEIERHEKTFAHNTSLLKNVQFMILVGIFILLLIILCIQLYIQIFPFHT